MIPGVVEISSPGLYLSKSRGFLNVKSNDGEVHKVPLDNIGVLLLTSPQATLSTALMNVLAERGIITMLCDTKHRPASYLYPYRPHEEMTGRLYQQIKAGVPLKKRLWQSLIKAKIAHQAFVLKSFGKDNVRHLEKLSEDVSSGDKENREAQAARIYWQALMGNDFRRIPRSDGINSLLDFGYGILRSGVLRAIAGSGLNPSLGISHSGKTNPFCLADDLLEPYRPLIDFAVFKLKEVECVMLSTDVKRFLAASISVKVETQTGKSPAARSMAVMCQTLTNSFESGKNQMEVPRLSPISCANMDSLWKEVDFSSCGCT